MFGFAALTPICTACGSREIPEDGADPTGQTCNTCHELIEARAHAERVDGFRFSALDWFRSADLERMPRGIVSARQYAVREQRAAGAGK